MAPRIPAPPWLRKLFAGGALALGVFVVSGQLKGNAPRDVEVHLSLRALEESHDVRAVELTFLRGATPLRSLTRRFAPGAAPRALLETFPLPEGRLVARVSVTLEASVVERDVAVTVVAGNPLELPAPAAP